jgi:hypothetical protein
VNLEEENRISVQVWMQAGSMIWHHSSPRFNSQAL